VRGIGRVPQNDGQHVTMVAAVGHHGLQAMMTVAGATEAAVFRADGKPGRGPPLSPGELVVLDHWGAHTAVGSQPMLARRRVRLLDLPPYSPDVAPIEPCGSKVKPALRKAQARSRTAREGALAEARATITATDAHGWLLHGGYALQEYENRSRPRRWSPCGHPAPRRVG
jgi:transposase